jgi:hypothetical protein
MIKTFPLSFASILACVLAGGCGGGASGSDVDAARAVSRAVEKRFTPAIPQQDIICSREEGQWRCRFDTRKGSFLCTLPSASAPPHDVECRKQN